MFLVVVVEAGGAGLRGTGGSSILIVLPSIASVNACLLDVAFSLLPILEVVYTFLKTCSFS